MKRSRVVDLINNQIEGYMNPSSSRFIAEKILRTMEEVGMLPPSYIYHNDSPDVFNNDEINEWESEE